MSNLSNNDSIVPQDLGLDDADVNDLGLIEALSQDEIEELISSTQLSSAERLGRLIEIRQHLAMRAASEFGDNDAASLLEAVERGIASLQTELDARADGPDGYELPDPAMDVDPLEHRETLAPDDDDLLDELEAEEEDDEDDEDGAELLAEQGKDELDEVLDPKEWDADGDGFDSEKGVH